jgi:hypothetical protein
MTIYNVHIYREMRLVFEGIEADSHEAAASIARDKPTGDADEIDDCDGETFYACVDVQADEEYEHSRWIDFEPERERRAAPSLLAALGSLTDQADEDCPEEYRTRHFKDALEQARDAIAAAEAAGLECPAPAPHPIVTLTAAPQTKPFSVLLLYPDYVNDGGSETYHAFVEASDALDAVAIAQCQAVAAQVADIDDPTDFAPLLVTEGHHHSQPLFNK